MGKKKKGKNSILNSAESNIKILKSGKVKIKKGQKISLKPYIKASLTNTICSRLEAILSKDDVVIDATNCRLSSTNNMNTADRFLNLVQKTGTNDVYTITHICQKSDCKDLFDYLNDDVIGMLLRSSTLSAIYKEVKVSWMELYDTKDKFTNVLFIPDIFVFVNPMTGEILKHPYMVNLLLVAEPSQKSMMDEIVKVEDEDAVRRYITDLYEAAIKCGAKHLVVDPFCNKLLVKYEHLSSELWLDAITTQRIIEQIRSVDFVIEEEDLYIIFSRTGVRMNNNASVDL